MYNYRFSLFIYVNLKIRSIYYSKNASKCCQEDLQAGFKTSGRASGPGRHLSDDGVSGLVMLEEEVVGLNEELAGVFLRLSHPPLPQQDGRVGVFVSVKLLRTAPQMEENADVK